MDKTIGIFGGGQLGRMMASSFTIKYSMYFFEANTDCPAGVLGQVFLVKMNKV